MKKLNYATYQRDHFSQGNLFAVELRMIAGH